MKSRAEEILSDMPVGICTTGQLGKQFKMADSDLLRVLRLLVDTGKIVQESICLKDNIRGRPTTVGWRRL